MLIGTSAVGKTAIMVRHTRKKFDNKYISTIGTAFISTEFQNPTPHRCKFKIWDTAGQERYRALVESFFTNTDAVIVTFSLNDKKSFFDLKDWIGAVRKSNIDPDKTVPMAIVGNKLDLCESADGEPLQES